MAEISMTLLLDGVLRARFQKERAASDLSVADMQEVLAALLNEGADEVFGLPDSIRESARASMRIREWDNMSRQFCTALVAAQQKLQARKAQHANLVTVDEVARALDRPAKHVAEAVKTAVAAGHVQANKDHTLELTAQGTGLQAGTSLGDQKARIAKALKELGVKVED